MQNVIREVKEAVSSNTERREGPVARTIEKTTAKLPSDLFLWSALGAMGASLTLKIMGRKHDALFVGQWAAPFLLLGVYNKLVKIGGHDQKTSNLSNEGEKVDLPSVAMDLGD
jgi:hypothetical protein